MRAAVILLAFAGVLSAFNGLPWFTLLFLIFIVLLVLQDWERMKDWEDVMHERVQFLQRELDSARKQGT